LPWNTTQPPDFMPTGHQSSIPNLVENATQSSNSTSFVPAPRLTVTVGDGGKLVFAPSSLDLSIGSTISFNFLGLNHTLTESSLRNPCEKSGGFDSGFRQFNPTNTSGKFIIEYKVVDRNPRWFFCAQTQQRPHCQAGMVFSLNPRGAHAEFLSNALAAIPLPTTTSEGACHQKPKSIFPPLGTGSSTVSSASTTTVLPLIVNSAGLSSYRQSVFALVAIFLL
jgi:plastocyanin